MNIIIDIFFNVSFEQLTSFHALAIYLFVPNTCPLENDVFRAFVLWESDERAFYVELGLARRTDLYVVFIIRTTREVDVKLGRVAKSDAVRYGAREIISATLSRLSAKTWTFFGRSNLARGPSLKSCESTCTDTRWPFVRKSITHHSTDFRDEFDRCITPIRARRSSTDNSNH